ncbi:MAG: hypothetical protein H0Z37_05185 [Firmicutes bacterium]|nr:hypothetical protein [Bacillota bacterium]
MSSMSAGNACHPGDARLLSSILARYPEIGSVDYCPRAGRFRFAFLLLGTGLDMPAFASRLRDSLKSYSFVTGWPVELLNIDWTEERGMTFLWVERDVSTLRPEELRLLTGLVRQAFSGRLVLDESGDGMEFDGPMQDELIAHMLEDLRQARRSRPMVGFRRAGQVVVYPRRALVSEPNR